MNITANEPSKLRTLSGKILVSQYDLLEKRRHKLTDEVELEIENKFNKNLRERNPQVGIVEAVFDECKDLKVGDRVLIHHFTFNDGNGDPVTPVVVVGGQPMYHVPYSECFYTLDENGEVERPVGDYVLCISEQEPEPEQTAGGVFIPQTATSHRKQRDQRDLTVLHAGNSPHVKVGDIIRANYHYEITINKNKYIRVREENILGVIEYDK